MLVDSNYAADSLHDLEAKVAAMTPEQLDSLVSDYRERSRLRAALLQGRLNVAEANPTPPKATRDNVVRNVANQPAQRQVQYQASGYRSPGTINYGMYGPAGYGFGGYPSYSGGFGGYPYPAHGYYTGYGFGNHLSSGPGLGYGAGYGFGARNGRKCPAVRRQHTGDQ